MKLKDKIVKTAFDTFQFWRRKYWEFFKIETFGVRVLVIKDDKILLVRHRYGDYWTMPGGKIEKNSNPAETALKELYEETGLIAEKIDYQLGFYKNTTGGKNDNVYCLVITDWRPDPDFKRKLFDWLEVAEMKWFSLDNLPFNLSPATKRRLEEFLQKQENLTGRW